MADIVRLQLHRPFHRRHSLGVAPNKAEGTAEIGLRPHVVGPGFGDPLIDLDRCFEVAEGDQAARQVALDSQIAGMLAGRLLADFDGAFARQQGALGARVRWARLAAGRGLDGLARDQGMGENGKGNEAYR